jgi:hypothetical protein
MAVNSGSTQLAADLGPLAHGMVFAQVVPSLECLLTAKALVMALQASGKELTRANFVGAIERSNFDLGGLSARYTNQSHEGSRFVDLSMYSREDRFIH